MSNILLWPYQVGLISKAKVLLLITISVYSSRKSWFTPVTFPITTKEIVFNLLPNPRSSLGRVILEVPLRAIARKSPAKVHIETFPTDLWDLDFLEHYKFKLHRVTFYPLKKTALPFDFYSKIIEAVTRLGPDFTVELNGHGPIRGKEDIPVPPSSYPLNPW